MIPFADVDAGRALAQAVVDTVREPLLVLDKDLRVVAASRSFYVTFDVNRQDTQGRLLYDLGDGQWNIPALKALLEKILPEQTVLEDYEVEHEFPHIGRRIMLLNARRVFDEQDADTTLLLAIEDVTGRRAIERDLAHLLNQKELLLEEMQHRIANSLQIIASILMLKARAVRSDETRGHLEDAHQRVLSVASIQKHLQPTGRGEQIDIAPYLRTLCASLAGSMIAENKPVSLVVQTGPGTMASSEAVNIGLIITESVINALKYAFPVDPSNAQITVLYAAEHLNWMLSISDNGVGTNVDDTQVSGGLGTTIVKALAHQLQAVVSVESSASGRTVTVTHQASAVDAPQAA